MIILYEVNKYHTATPNAVMYTLFHHSTI